MENLVIYRCSYCCSPQLEEQKGGLIYCKSCNRRFEKKIEKNVESEEALDARISFISQLGAAENLLRESPPRFYDAESKFRLFIEDYPDYCDGYWGLVRARYGIKYEKDVNGQLIPSCYISDYEDFLKDEDYEKALELAKKEATKDAYYYLKDQGDIIADICKEWREKVGKYNYDIFISFKDEDKEQGISDEDRKEMTELYTHLLEQKYNVFFSPKSMKKHTGKYYDPYIFSALQSAKVLVVYGSKPEYFTSTWVQNEWTRFIRMMAKQEKKPGSCIAVYNGFNPKLLPKDLRETQAIDASKDNRLFYPTLLNTIKNLLKDEEKPDENEELKKQIKELQRQNEENKKQQEELKRQNEENKKRQEELQKSLEEERKKNSLKQAAQKPSTPSTGEKNAPKAPSKVTPKEEPKKPEIDPDFEIVDGCLVEYKGNKAEVVIPDGVTSIGDEAFSWCPSLTSVVIPNSVTSIGAKAFLECASLTSITVGSNNPNYMSIDGNLYSKDGKTLIQYAIGKKDTSFTIPNSVTSIGERAFWGCSSLTSIAIPNSVTSIGNEAFPYCSSLNSITVDSNNPNYMSIDGNLYSKDGKTFIQYAIRKKDTSFKIPSSVTSIGNNAFAVCSSLTSVVIPDSVTSIGVGAFDDCSSLTSVVIPDSVTSIGDCAFYYCNSLNSVVIPNGVTSIGDWAFSWCNSLNSVVIPDSVTSIGRSAFWACENLTIFVHSLDQVKKWKGRWNPDNRPVRVIEQAKQPIVDPDFEIVDGCLKKYKGNKAEVVIPNGVTSIGDRAFSICFELISITIPDSVTSIGNGAFSNCSSLTSVTIPKSVTHIGGGAFSYCNLDTIVCHSPNYQVKGGCLIEDGTKVIIGTNNSVIPYGVTTIAESAFAGRKALTHINIPDSVTFIGSHSFSCCESLTDITIPDNVTSIESMTFASCENLSSVVIGRNVTHINYNAFIDCNIDTIACHSPKYRVESGCLIEDGTKVIIGTNNSVIPYGITTIGDCAFSGRKKLTVIDIPDSVTSINGFAFNNCENLTNITIPNGVTNIDSFVFDRCFNLVNIVIPDSVTNIGNYAFSSCMTLNNIVIPNSVASVGTNAFFNCENLTIFVHSLDQVKKWDENWNPDNCPVKVIEQAKQPIVDPDFEIVDGCLKKYKGNKAEVVIPDNVTSIGDEAFYGCKSLTSAVIPDSVTSIGKHAFSWCPSLTSIVIPNNVTSIGNLALSYCSSLTNITVNRNNPVFKSIDDDLYTKDGKTLIQYAIGKKDTTFKIPISVTSIGSCAFVGCMSLTSIDIPHSITSIGYCAFSYCHGLTSVVVPDSVTYIGSNAFYDCYKLTSVKFKDPKDWYVGENSKSPLLFLNISSVAANNLTKKFCDKDWHKK